MKMLVVYYSLEGNTKFVAEKIAEQTGAEMLCLEPKKAYPDGKVTKYFWGGRSAIMGEAPKLKPYNVELSAYEMIVLGTPVWASTFTPPLRSFLENHKEELKEKKVAFFACSAGGNAEKCFENLRREMGISEGVISLSLTDPKWKQAEENLLLIEEFCKKIKEI